MADSKVKMDYQRGKAIVTKIVVDESGISHEVIEEIDIPKVEFGQGTIRKTMIGEDGKSYEVEQVINIPIFKKNATEEVE